MSGVNLNMESMKFTSSKILSEANELTALIHGLFTISTLILRLISIQHQKL
jgi:hypothetical protein